MKHAVALGLMLSAAAVMLAAPLAAQPAEASQPDAQRSIVVVADLSPDATANARLRASLYEAARARGLEPFIRADVDGAALRTSSMTAGQITADPAQLDQLRAALGVAYLGRVSKEFDQGGSIGVKVTLITPKGPRTESVQVAAGAPNEPVEAAFGRLLDGAGVTAAPPPAPEPETAPAATVVAGGLVLDAEDAPIEKSGAQVREEWEARGGAIPTFAVFALATGQQHRGIPVSGAPPGGGARETGTATANGIGGGIGARLAFWYMSLPEPITGQGVFPVFRLGLGLDSNFLYVNYPTGYTWGGSNQTRAVAYDSRGFWLVNVPFQVGFHMGIGKFTTQTTWRGAVVGLAYSPSMQFELDMNQTEGVYRFNAFGAELSIDLTTIDTQEIRETQIRLMIYGLYPKDDKHPGMVTAALGAAFY